MSLIELHSQREEASGPSGVCWMDLLSYLSGIHHAWRGLTGAGSTQSGPDFR